MLYLQFYEYLHGLNHHNYDTSQYQGEHLQLIKNNDFNQRIVAFYVTALRKISL